MFDICIIGGGVVGTAIFNKLTRLGKKCVLIERQNDVGFGASRANTALLHSGIDCKPNTLKAKLNVRGNEIFPQILTRLKVPFTQNGHLIIGNDVNKLNDLLNRAKLNGVKGCKLIRDQEIHKLEPNISDEIKNAIFVPSGGMISSYELAVAFAEEAILNGGIVLREFETKKIIKSSDCYKVVANDGRMLETKYIINACGENFNKINKLLNAEEYKTEFRRGEYYLLDNKCKNFVNHPIFPLPTEKSKGILISPTVHGNILIGPTSYPSDTSTKTTNEGLLKIKEEVSINFKNIPFRENIRIFSGVRTICGDDFIIEKSKKVNGLINVAGICSPGLSSCPAIAEMVAQLLGLDYKNEIPDLKQRKGITRLNTLSIKKQNEIILKNPDFGKVVCRCENISLGEIKEALTSPLPAISVDAVKRRTRAGMGRCQSGFCIFQVMEELAKNQNIPFSEIQKDGLDSKIIACEIKPSIKKRGE